MKRLSKAWFLLLAVLVTGCPRPSTGGDFEAEQFRPQQFEYGGYRIVYAPTPREALEFRWVLPHAGDSLAPLLTQTALAGISPEERLHVRHLGVQHRSQAEIIHLGTTRGHLAPALAAVGKALDQPVSDDMLLSAILEEEQLLRNSARKLQGPGLLALAHAKIRQLPEGASLPLGLAGLPARDSLVTSWAGLRNRSQMTLVVVGNVSYEDLVDGLLGLHDGLPMEAASTEMSRLGPDSSAVWTQEWEQANGFGKMGLALHFEAPGAAERAGVLAAKAAVEVHLAERFRDIADLLTGLRIREMEGGQGIWLEWEGYRMAPVAELVMSELRQSRDGLTLPDRMRMLREKALGDALARSQSNARWADHLADRVSSRRLDGMVDEWLALSRMKGSDLEKFMAENGQEVVWFFVGNAEKIDPKAILRF